MQIDQNFLRIKVNTYVAEYDLYKGYAKFLNEALTKASKRLAPFSLVESRPKGIPSFAEKVVRKQWKYQNVPGYDLTDRCGARVVTATLEAKDLMCDYIRKRFLIDEANSLDKRSELRTDQFGYLSVHYVVQLPEGLTELEGVALPAGIVTGPDGFKAEIQVRTLFEHAWANALHDRLYKVAIRVPASLQRDAAGLAATIETADTRISRLTQDIDSYLGHYAAYSSKEKLAEEITVLSTVRQFEKDTNGKAALALRIGGMMAANGQLDEAITQWEAAVLENTPSRMALQVELGKGLCLRDRDQPKSEHFRRGQDLLRQVVEAAPAALETELPAERMLRAEAAHQLAWSLSRNTGQEEKVRHHYGQALALAPDNPYHFTASLIYEIYCLRNVEFVNVMRPAMEQAIARCRAHIAVGIEIPRAYFTISRLYLLAHDDQAAINAYLDALRVVLAPESSCPEWIFEEEFDLLRLINFGKALPPKHQVVHMLLQLAAAFHRRHGDGLSTLAELTSSGAQIFRDSGKTSALVIAGGASNMPPAEAVGYAGFLQDALRHVDGLVCSGGTNVGIPGLVGQAAVELAAANAKGFTLIGYLPNRLPLGVQVASQGYNHIFPTDSEEFSLREPLQNWIDLLASGITPEQVRVLGINGGQIAAFEYRLALALGAKVGILEQSGRAADALLMDPAWSQHPGLIRLPSALLLHDPATVRAFVRPVFFALDKAQLEALAKIAHDRYLAETTYSDVDPVRQKYEKLREDLKESNRQQISYAAEILATEGYVVRPTDLPPKQIPIPDFSGTEIERMAELEHGRWNMERLTAGWRHAKGNKDVARKTNPCIVPWNDLPDGENGVKKYDRSAITNYAQLLAQAGYEVVKKQVKE